MYKEKVRNLLKEVPEVKEQMNKLEFGSLVKYIGNFPRYYEGIHKVLYLLGDLETIETIGGKEQSTSHTLIKEEYEIIGLPLQERFIRMYCENKGIPLTIQNNFLYIFGRKIGKIDNTKDFDNQSETFYKELYEALLEINK